MVFFILTSPFRGGRGGPAGTGQGGGPAGGGGGGVLVNGHEAPGGTTYDGQGYGGGGYNTPGGKPGVVLISIN